MLYLLLGPNSYTKDQHIHRLTREWQAVLEVLRPDELQKKLTSGGGADLFSKKKAYRVDVSPDTLNDEQLLAAKKSKDQYLFLADSLDQRKNTTKKLLTDKEIVIENFPNLNENELPGWIKTSLKKRKAQASSDAVFELIKRLGVETPDLLWRIENELDKLCLHAGGREITKANVVALVAENLDIQSFELVNALAKKDRKLTFSYLNDFYNNDSAGDDKSKTIQLAALVGEQLRSILLIKSFKEAGARDADIVSETKWKPARISIVGGLARNFETKKLLGVLKKFEHLDVELKSTTTPPRVLLDLIIAQLI